MITVKKLKPRIFEVTLSGVVEASDMAKMKRVLSPALEAEGKMGMIVRMEALEDMTGDALIADARFEMSMLPQWSKVARVAVVTDKQAFEAILNWFDPVLPMIEFRTFGSSEVSKAQSWASDLSGTEAAEGPGVRIVEGGADGLLVVEVDGKMTAEGAEHVFAAFDKAAEQHGKINLMVRVKDYEGFDPGLLGRDMMTAKFGAIGKIGRYALVGAPDWMRTIMQGMGALMPIEMRAFDASEDAAAYAWASAG